MGNVHLVTGYAGQPHVSSADQGSFNAAMVGSGQYVLHNGNQFSASVITNNQIHVLDGDILMQGRHIRLNGGNYVDLTIENGQQGYYRNDLIVVRYTKNAETGVEDANLLVIKGAATTKTPADPAYTKGDIINGGDVMNDMPLYRVPLDGLNVQELVPMFTVTDATPEQLLAKIENAVPKSGTSANSPMTGNLVVVKNSPTVQLNTQTSYGAQLQATSNSLQMVAFNSAADRFNGEYRALVLANTAGKGLSEALRLSQKTADSTNSESYCVIHSGNLEALGVTQIQRRTYRGADMVGANNPNSLTFNFVPKVVVVQSGRDFPTFFVQGVSSAFGRMGGVTEYGILSVTWDDKSLSWYSTEIWDEFNAKSKTATTRSQLNSLIEYTVIAFG